MFFNRVLRSLHVDGSEFKEIRELEEVGSMLCDIDTWPEKWMQEGIQIGMDKMSGKMKEIQEKLIQLQQEKEEAIRQQQLEKEEAIRQQQLEKEEAIRQQQQQSKENTAMAMLKDGLPHETIARYTNLTIEEITELAESN
ncbi:MAG: hypothetical protein ACOYI9_13765 [Candidatus Hydrogenedentales bacterium]|jgi:site-specific DNA-cytosine methylase